MSNKAYQCLLVSDFTIDNFSGLISNDEQSPLIEATVAPFGQVLPVLLNYEHDCWKKQYDLIVVWSQPQAVIESFNDVLQYKPVDYQKIHLQVENYIAAIKNVVKMGATIFVPTWIQPQYNRGFGMTDMNTGFGISGVLMKMNLQLAEGFSNDPNIFLLNTQNWASKISRPASNPKLWYMGKVPYSNEFYLEALKDIKAAINGINGNAKKLIILDLDDTLWGGIVGDDGWENLNLGGHNPNGEAFVDFQSKLKALTNRGILLGIVSKNEETLALEAIEKHPEMVLKKNDFAGWRINWRDKAQNIIELVEELNLGLQSTVFLDDNPRERDRVKSVLPEVLVPDMPKDKMLYVSTLLNLNCFDTPNLSHEDLQRSEMYQSERTRTELKNSLGSMDDWLTSLQTEVKIEPLNSANVERTAQLINKTNQMNLSTRRLTVEELITWEKKENHWLRTLRVSDKLGDSGLTGIVSLVILDNKAHILDFILSCRVMGRKIEDIMVHFALEYARACNAEYFYADYLPTKKNKPCFSFFESSGFNFHDELKRFSWPLSQQFQLHDFARVTIEAPPPNKIEN